MKYPRITNYLRLYHIFAGYCCIFILDFKILTNGLAKGYVESRSNNLGWISPSGEVIKRTGQGLKVFCTINAKSTQVMNFNNTNLKFVKDGEFLISQNVSEVNKTTISLYLSNGNKSDNVYKCVLTGNKIQLSSLNDYNRLVNNNKHVPQTSNSSYESEVSFGTIRIVVGEKPKVALDFRCILYHLSTLNCSWVVQKNYVNTTYTIQYVPSMNAEKNATAFKCPNNDDEKKNFCLWSPITNPPYYNIYKKLNVTLIGVNMFGNVEQYFIFNQTEHLKPEPPSDFRVYGLLPTILELRWNVAYLQYYTVDFILNIKFWVNSKMSQHICYSQNLTKENENFIFRIKNKIANSDYKLLISMKLQSAPPFEEYWSETAVRNVHTYSLHASYDPNTAVSFRILNQETSSRGVSIYWTLMKYSKQYGNINYVIDVSQVDENGELNKDTSVIQYGKTMAQAQYTIGLSCYRFFISAENSRGKAINSSLITIPAANCMIQIPVGLYLTEIRENNLPRNKSYDCTLQLPNKEFDVKNYTLFWFWYYTDSCGRTVEAVNNMSTILHTNSGHTHRIQFEDGARQSQENLTLHWGIMISVNTGNSSTGLQFPDSHVFSISDSSRQFLKEKQKSVSMSLLFIDRLTFIHTPSYKFCFKH